MNILQIFKNLCAYFSDSISPEISDDYTDECYEEEIYQVKDDLSNLFLT